MRVVVTNVVLANGGDAAILLGLIEALRRSSPAPLELTVLEANPAAQRQLYPDLDLRPTLARIWADSLPAAPDQLRSRLNWARLRLWERRIRRALQRGRTAALDKAERGWLSAYSSADLVVSTGGTYLTDNYRLAPRLLELEAARWAGKPLVLYTQSIGPLATAAARRMVGEALGAADLVLLRDDASRKTVEALGVPRMRHRVVADAAFGLPLSSRAMTSTGAASRGGPPKIGISVRHWRHYRRVDPAAGQAAYRRAVAGLVVHLVSSHGAEVVFLSTCQGIPAYAADDSAEAAAIVGSLPAAVAARVTVDRAPHRPEDVVEHYAGCDAVVATRMHAGILAMLGGTPVVPIAYEFKTAELYRRLAVPDWVVDIETVTERALVAGVERILTCPEEARARVAEMVALGRSGALAAGREALKAGLGSTVEGAGR